MSQPLPVTVIGGYLGSGKTTMVNHLLRNADGLRLAVLVNEFGELAIDEDLIEAEDDDIISIAGGCVCCSFGSDLSAALIDMAQLDPPPDHLLVESSGIAIPSAIVGSVSLLDGFQADSIVILADAETIRANAQSKYMSDTVLRQITDANIIVLNKTDLVDAPALAETRNWLKAQNPGARIVETQQGAVPPATILASFLGRTKSSKHHAHLENFETSTLIPDRGADVEALAKDLASEASGLIRAKGFVTDKTGQKKLIQVVGNRYDITDAPDHMEDGIVCLGYKEQSADTTVSG